MHWMEMKRRLVILGAGSVLLLAACGGGGGDKTPTGPGGGGNTATYDLVRLGLVGLPADTQLEDCTETRFYGGALKVGDDGSWQINLQVHDHTGDWGYLDKGQIEQDGNTLWFDSQVSDMSYQGTVEDNVLKIMYDWCANGVPDVQLVFH
jgi:hypothetical protein